jgi:hypothetical protein
LNAFPTFLTAVAAIIVVLTVYIGFDSLEQLNHFVGDINMLRELGTAAGFLSIAAVVAALFTEDRDR